nr:Cthe_2314 family HEPN domain-containing protein [uncultured Flavobacterium sp.]
MDEKKKLIDFLFENSFSLEYVKVIAPIMAAHMKDYLEQDEITDFDKLGTKKEIKLKEISKHFGLLQTVVNDLEKVLVFLRFGKRTELKEIYPELESQQDYYIYHFENYLIRVNSITDIIGKLGNAIYETGIEKPNGYSFKEAIKGSDKNLAEILERLLKKTKEIKTRRHEKIHTGETKISYLESIAFWDDINKIIGKQTAPILEEYTDKNLLEAAEKVEDETLQIISIISEFLEHSTSKFLVIANS